MSTSTNYIRWFNELTIDDIPLVGGKNASLGEMYQELSSQGIQIPNGFAVTAEGYRYLLDQAKAWEPLHSALDNLNPDDVTDLAERARTARDIIYAAPFPLDLEQQIIAAYAKLQMQYGAELSVAVRSSATAEDLPTASFAGQQDTYLNIRGNVALLEACKRCFASLFTDRAIHYRIDQGFDHFKLALSIGIMKMVRSDLNASGVMFSLDTESGFNDVVFITGAYGLGENVVQGAVDPDEFYVHKPTFNQGFRSVLKRNLGSKKIKMIYSEGRTHEPTRNIAPVLKASFPKNFSVNFKGSEINLTFDEYVKLKNVNKQLIISPPMKTIPMISPLTASRIINIKIYSRNEGIVVGIRLKHFQVTFTKGGKISSWIDIFF